MRKALVLLVLALLLVPNAGLSPVAAEGPQDSYFQVRTTTLEDGTVLAQTVISGPPDPPPGFARTTATKLPVPSATEGVNILSDVPAFDWSFGCSATSAAMIAGYYDRTGYGNMYAGPTNGGVMPLDNSVWPDWVDSAGATRNQCPLSATHNGLDGRTTNGHVDDYWISYLAEGPDPFEGNWPEHSYGDCTADYMKTNQWAYGNVDGSTTFYNFTDGSPLHWYDMEGYGIDNVDGGYGIKLFYESRGYTVTEMYNQYIRGYASPTLGFTYDQYKAEIDAGYPVMFHVAGHTMVGIGYDDASNLMYIHDTWDYDVHTMIWGGSYSGMQHYGVTIVHLEPISTPPAAPTGLTATAAGSDQIDLSWTDNATNETGFKIERCDGEGCSDFGLIATVGANVISYSNTGLAASTPYYYRVYAYNAAGNSAYDEANATTSDDTTAPDPPADLVATGRDGAVDLAWTANSEPDLAGYTVYRSTTSGGPYTALTGSLLSDPSYTDSSVANGTTYFYVVTASDDSDNESGNSNEAEATPQVQVIVDVASADYATTYGTVSGTYLATQTQDDSYQSLTEVHSGGKPSNRYDQVEHIWQFEITSGNHVFNVDAYYVDADADEADTGFDFSWSTSPTGSWTDLLTVDKTADDDTYQAADLGAVSGTIYVRAVDNDRTPGENANDTLYVDHMYIDGGAPPTEPPDPATNPNPADAATNVSTTPTLSWTAGAGAESHDVYFGAETLEFQGNQTSTSFSPGDLALNTTYYWRIDEVNSVDTTTGDVWSFTTQASGGPTTMHVHSIALDTVREGGTVHGRATVIVVDNLGGFVGSAVVEGTFTGSYNETLTDTTGPDGVVALITAAATKKPVFTFCVDDSPDGITHPYLTYEPDDNVVTCASYP